MFDLPKMTPEEIIEELREKAREEIDDMNADVPAVMRAIGVERFSVEDHICWQAADLLETLIRRG